MVRTAYRLLRHSIAAALFPGRCLECGQLYHPPFPAAEPHAASDLKSAAAQFTRKVTCATCAPKIQLIESPLCSRCGMVFDSREGEDHPCGDCIKAPRYFTAARAAAVYDAVLMTAILQLKYKGRTGLAEPLGRILLFSFVHHFSNPAPDIIIPVPLHPRKMKQRGFNQVFLMLHDWETLLPQHGHQYPFQIRKNVLHKKKNTAAQTGLNKQRRAANIRGAFQVDHRADITGKSILLVDDVYTTGATADECARVLRKSGAHRVDVLTLARTL
jgi:ComF family protein